MPELFLAPPRLLTGQGCFEKLGEEAARVGRRCLIVTGRGAMRAQGFLPKAQALLKAAGVESFIFEGVEHDPAVATVDAVRATLKQNRCDLALGLGGGSAIDAAKAAVGLVNETEPTVAFFDGRPIAGTGLPLIAAPSTFGTGSEATIVAVLSDPARKLKRSIRHARMLPSAAVVDPLLGAGASSRLTAACGLDALTQAIESHLAAGSTDLTRALSRQATALIAAALPRLHADPADLGAREMQANGSLLAGMALNNARLGLVHGLAHPLGARYGLAHGEACGILLPHVLRFNRETARAGYDEISDLLGQDAAEFCLEMLRRFALPTDLKHLKIPAADFAALVAETMPSGSTKANPRPVRPEDVLELLRELC